VTSTLEGIPDEGLTDEAGSGFDFEANALQLSLAFRLAIVDARVNRAIGGCPKISWEHIADASRLSLSPPY
jgi:hypothetical protein